MQSRKQQVPDGITSPSLHPAVAPSGPQLFSQFPHPKKRVLSSECLQVAHDLDYLRSAIRVIPDFPKPGVSFKDITPLLRDPVAYNMLIQLMKERVQSIGGGVNCIASIESRGNLIAAPLAYEMKLPLVRSTGIFTLYAMGKHTQFIQIDQVLIRKSSKSPGCTVGVDFRVGYGTEHLEVADDSVQPGQRVFIVDDLLGSGTTMQAACHLIERVGGVVASCCCVCVMPELQGLQKLSGPCIVLIPFESDAAATLP